MIQVNRIYLIFNRLVTKKFLVDTSECVTIMTSKRKLYREDEKLFFLHSYYQSGMSKHAFCRAHGICCPALLNSWIKKYSNLAEELSLPSEQESPDMSNRSKEAYKDENAQLKKRIKELEKALSFSKLETEARELMITRAEELFNIPIRKKSGAKS